MQENKGLNGKGKLQTIINARFVHINGLEDKSDREMAYLQLADKLSTMGNRAFDRKGANDKALIELTQSLGKGFAKAYDSLEYARSARSEENEHFREKIVTSTQIAHAMAFKG